MKLNVYFLDFLTEERLAYVLGALLSHPCIYLEDMHGPYVTISSPLSWETIQIFMQTLSKYLEED